MYQRKGEMNQRKLSKVMNGFAYKLYGQVSAEKRFSNIIIAPPAVFTDLSMVLRGARGKTEAEIMEVMGIADITDKESFHKVSGDVRRSTLKTNSILKVFNKLWVQKDMEINEKLKTDLTEFYVAEFGVVDFLKKPHNAKAEINNWIYEQTNEGIFNILEKNCVLNDMRVLITNALHFKGLWLTPFKKSKTQKSDFHTADGMTVAVEMMRNKNNFGYFNSHEYDCQVLTLKYTAPPVKKMFGSKPGVLSSLRMMIILPMKRNGIYELEQQILIGGFQENISDWISDAEEEEVEVFLPKFTIYQKTDILVPLRGLGINDLFTKDADLSHTSFEDELNVSSFSHQVRIEVNEKGTETAAACAAKQIIASSVGGVPTFMADHPFLFCVYDHDTEIILVLGRYCGGS